MTDNHTPVGIRRRTLLAASIAAALLASSTSIAEAATPREELEAATEVEFVNVPIEEVCAKLSQKHAIPIRLAPGVRPSIVVTCTDAGPLKAVLAKMLAPHALFCTADDTAIWIRQIPR
jgi:hypothetical protein